MPPLRPCPFSSDINNAQTPAWLFGIIASGVGFGLTAYATRTRGWLSVKHMHQLHDHSYSLSMAGASWVPTPSNAANSFSNLFGGSNNGSFTATAGARQNPIAVAGKLSNLEVVFPTTIATGTGATCNSVSEPSPCYTIGLNKAGSLSAPWPAMFSMARNPATIQQIPSMLPRAIFWNGRFCRLAHLRHKRPPCKSARLLPVRLGRRA